jgi:hypothetical protein
MNPGLLPTTTCAAAATWPARAAAVLLALLSACGNYSNDDLDFALAVPKREELTAKLPGQKLIAPDAAEYYRATREVGTSFNLAVIDLTSLVDDVRSLPPSDRNGGERIWGPFSHRYDRDWEIRLRMWREAVDGDAGFRYRFEFHRTGAPASPWHGLLSGTFALSRRHGELDLDLDLARKNGYPVAEFKDLLRLTLRYQRRQHPFTVEMTLANVPESPNPEATYSYTENADGSGGLAFVWRRRDNMLAQAAEMRSRWNAEGAGRADARIIEGLAAIGNALGVDCWDQAGRSTYLLREYGTRREEGSLASCVFTTP